jgi:hypothetical protein
MEWGVYKIVSLTGAMGDHMTKSDNSHERVIFRRGEKVTNDHFIGTAWLEMLVPDDRTFNCPIGGSPAWLSR